MIIDCAGCEMHETEHCKDCFVMALLSRGDEAVDLDDQEVEAIKNLQEAGLAPVLKFRPRKVS